MKSDFVIRKQEAKAVTFSHGEIHPDNGLLTIVVSPWIENELTTPEMRSFEVNSKRKAQPAEWNSENAFKYKCLIRWTTPAYGLTFDFNSKRRLDSSYLSLVHGETRENSPKSGGFAFRLIVHCSSYCWTNIQNHLDLNISLLFGFNYFFPRS